MKYILSLIFILFSLTSFSQLKKYQREVDSLSNLYKKNVIGFSRTVTLNIEPRETFIIYYIENGEVEDFIAWGKVIDSDKKIIILGNMDEPKREPIEFTIPVFYENNLIGGLKNGYFIKIEKFDYVDYAVTKKIQPFLENDEQLDKWLRIKFGGYYRGFK